MRNVLSISFFMIFTLAACCIYAQTPSKQAQRTQQTSETTKKPVTNNKYACWKIEKTDYSYTEYRWDTEDNVRQWVNEKNAQGNETYQFTSSVNYDVNTCDASNEKFQPKKCWKITGSKNGQGLEMCMWSTENVARRKIAELQTQGYQQAKYVETPAGDEKSCLASQTNTNPREAACWKITVGNTVTHIWGYETEAQTIVTNAQNSGQTASYELSPNETKDSCK